MKNILEQIKFLLIKWKLKGQTVLKFEEVGCQARDEFEWVGKIIRFDGDYVVVKIIKYNLSYTDIRDGWDHGTYKYNYRFGNVQRINGVLMIFN